MKLFATLTVAAALMFIASASQASSTTQPPSASNFARLKACAQSAYWRAGNYQLRIMTNDVSKANVMLALKTLHAVGGPDANITIVFSHSFNSGQLIEFKIAGVDESGVTDQARHDRVLEEVADTLEGKAGLDLDCAYNEPGGVVVHNGPVVLF